MTEPNLEQEITNIFITIDNYGTAEEARVDIRKLIANQVKEARLDELQRFDWCDYEGCGAYVHDRLAKLKEQTNDLR